MKKIYPKKETEEIKHASLDNEKYTLTFDRSKLHIKPLHDRMHDLSMDIIKPICSREFSKTMEEIALRILSARNKNKSIIVIMGGHVIRSGVQKYIIDLMERGYISCLAMNGAGMIHDFELALIGATTESVARYIKEGQFGLWKETAQLNDIINEAYAVDKTVGMGAAVGKFIAQSRLPYTSISLLAHAYRLDIPATVHVGIGYDIIHEHPNCDGASLGALSYNDFLKFAAIVQNLENGVVMNFGSAVMGPEVYLKALSMARNVAHQGKKVIRNFTTVVCDLYELPDDFRDEPSKNNPGYYFRPWKTMLVRTVAEGGDSYYIKGQHAETIPALWTAIKEHESR